MAPGPAGHPTIRFHRTKYGRELLVDAGFLRRLPGFDFSDRPYALAFFDVLLVTRGQGTFELDGRTHPIRPDVMLFTRPGEVRRLRARGLDGACLFFTPEFVHEAFADPSFLDRLSCFAPGRREAALAVSPRERRTFLARFREMEGELRAPGEDVPDVLRGQLHHVLVMLNRWYAARHGAAAPVPARVDRFRRSVSRDFATRHRVVEYARELGVTPGHLSALCRAHLGRGASALIRERLRLEARRLLLYSDWPVAEVGYRLGFDDPAYFSRFFRRETGQAPRAFRARYGAGGAAR